MTKPFLQTLQGAKTDRVPFWLMRQAGRHLPEYMEIRAKAKNFLDFCFTPDLAVEATLQPIRRYGMDAAILFSDILVVPYALGQKVWFETGHGPKLEALDPKGKIPVFDAEAFHARLAPVYETIDRLREDLPPQTTLIGFAGAPWTVATYMIEGGSSRDFARSKAWGFGQPDHFATLLDVITNATISYLLRQIEAGAEAIQLFDSWAGALDPVHQRRWSLDPCQKIIAAVKARYPGIPVILFPRGVGANYITYARHTSADALSLDTTVPLDWAAQTLQPHVTVQGNLDPLLLVEGGPAFKEAVARILENLSHKPFVFNLGHGVVPQTPIAHVMELADILHTFKRAS